MCILSLNQSLLGYSVFKGCDFNFYLYGVSIENNSLICFVGWVSLEFSSGSMNESCSNASASSSSSLNSSQDTEDDQTIASILAQEKLKTAGRLGKRLSHLDSVPVCCSMCPFCSCLSTKSLKVYVPH